MVVLKDSELLEYFRQTGDYVFLESVSVEPGLRAEGIKTLSDEEWVFPMHFPKNPLLPGVFQMEMIQQTGGLIINTLEGKKELPLYFYSAKEVCIKKAAKPGDTLKADVELLRYKRGVAKFHGALTVNDELSCEMDFSLISPEEIVGDKDA